MTLLKINSCRWFIVSLKHADFIPVYKKNKKCDQPIYRPVSILANISKIYEKLISKQLSKYFDSLIVINQCGFGKGSSSQYCLLVILPETFNTVNQN